jgi:hypothetical protein
MSTRARFCRLSGLYWPVTVLLLPASGLCGCCCYYWCNVCRRVRNGGAKWWSVCLFWIYLCDTDEQGLGKRFVLLHMLLLLLLQKQQQHRQQASDHDGRGGSGSAVTGGRVVSSVAVAVAVAVTVTVARVAFAVAALDVVVQLLLLPPLLLLLLLVLLLVLVSIVAVAVITVAVHVDVADAVAVGAVGATRTHLTARQQPVQSPLSHCQPVNQPASEPASQQASQPGSQRLSGCQVELVLVLVSCWCRRSCCCYRC